MVILLYLLAILFSVTQSASTKRFRQISAQSSVFNALKASTALILFALMAAGGFRLHLPTVLFGCSYGASLCLSMYAGYQALCRGPMALTSMLVSFSVLLPLIWGVTVGNEALKGVQYAALLLFFLALILMSYDKLKEKGDRGQGGAMAGSDYGLWLLFVAITFATNGICSILQTQHQHLYPGQLSGEFMLFAMLLCTVIYLFAALSRIPLRDWKAIHGKRYGVISGLANGASGFLTLHLAGTEQATVLFPILSAGTILASLLCGRVLFGEKLKINHYLALLAGGAAVVLLKL